MVVAPPQTFGLLGHALLTALKAMIENVHGEYLPRLASLLERRDEWLADGRLN